MKRHFLKTGAISTASCDWSSNGDDTTSVTVVVLTPPGTRDTVKAVMQIEVKDAKDKGAEVSGVGDYATYVSTGASTRR
jgi:hypothetical protein